MPGVITYNGVDITGKVYASEVTHEMYAGGHPDTLAITFRDDRHLWAGWEPRIGDTITYQNEGVSTGLMYIYDIDISNLEIRLFAYSLPTALKTRYTKAWEEVYLSQIFGELSEESEIKWIEDVWYKYKQCNTKISSFLNTTAELEAAVFVCYNGKAMMINEAVLEAQEPSCDIYSNGSSITVSDRRAQMYDGCIVQSGEYSGVFRVSSGERIYRPDVDIPCYSDAEAIRYAKGLLRMANKQMYSIRLQHTLLPKLSAGICVNLVNDKMAEHKGRMYVYRIRHEYHRNITTMFLRKPLEGY